MKPLFCRLNLIVTIILIIILTSCQPDNKLIVDVSKIPVNLQIERFDTAFYGQNPEKLPGLKKQYPYMFPAYVPDSIWQKKMQDSLLLDLKTEVDSIYPDNQKFEASIKDLFRHIKYYYPKFKAPKIITLYSDWNYLKKAVYLDSLELLTLDNFLGENNRLYKGIPAYIRQNMTPANIPVAVAKSIIETQIKPAKSKNLLSKMVNYGKQLYFLDAYLPQTPDYLKIGYTEKKMKWAQQNEEAVWQYFIENDLLYSTKSDLNKRFLNLAPYSKFYTEQDMESPGYIGRYIGWKIVRSFMKKNKVSLQKLLRTPEEEIFKKSNYKPKK